MTHRSAFQNFPFDEFMAQFGQAQLPQGVPSRGQQGISPFGGPGTGQISTGSIPGVGRLGGIESLQRPPSPQQAFPTFGAQPSQNFLGPVSDFFRGQQQNRAQEQAIGSARAQFFGQQAFAQSQQLGGILDRAAQQQQGLFRQGQRSLLTAINDPNLLSLIGLAGRRAREPGLPPDILRSIRGGAAARTAAGSSAALRNARFRLGGVSGPAREFILSSIRRRGAEAGQRQLADIDITAAQFAQQQQGQAIEQQRALLGQRAGLIGARANFLGQFNPLGQIQQIQQIQQPFSQVGFGIGQLGF